MTEPPPGAIAREDQGEAEGLSDGARVSAFYHRLQRDGMAEEQAFTLTKTYLEGLWGLDPVDQEGEGA